MVEAVTEAALAIDFGIVIIAAAAVGFVATRAGQPTIIAYIVTGLLLGPAVLGVVEPGVLTETMAELGLAFLLFLLGIKMRIDEIRDVLVPIVKISLPQMTLVALVGLGTAFVLGFGLWESVIIGLAVMYSSTAVIIKMLTDKGTATHVKSTTSRTSWSRATRPSSTNSGRAVERTSSGTSSSRIPSRRPN